MKIEDTFNTFLAKELAHQENPEGYLTERLADVQQRALELNSARQEMAEGYTKVLQGLKKAYPQIDLDDPNFLDTPNRMARALLEVCSGMGAENKEIFETTFPSESYNQVIILRDIDFSSLCSHHFFPFNGKAHVGYLPDTTRSNSKVVGLSKLARIVDIHARRPQLQERLNHDIMHAIKTELNPAGVMVVLEARHGCLSCRGAKKLNASMITSALDGKFKENEKLRAEFLALIHNEPLRS